MFSTFAIECIQGILKTVQTVKYSNGKIIKRIMAEDQRTPEEIIQVN